MYIQSADELKLHQATNVSLKIENTLLSKQLRNSENCLHYSDSLRNLQMTERNLLLVELSDQLIVLRRKLEREEHIANHVIAHDACSVRLLDKKLIASVKRKVITVVNKECLSLWEHGLLQLLNLFVLNVLIGLFYFCQSLDFSNSLSFQKNSPTWRQFATLSK